MSDHPKVTREQMRRGLDELQLAAANYQRASSTFNKGRSEEEEGDAITVSQAMTAMRELAVCDAKLTSAIGEAQALLRKINDEDKDALKTQLGYSAAFGGKAGL